jgi:hypothetical protein
MNDLFDTAADQAGGPVARASGIELFEAALVGRRRAAVRHGEGF